MSSNQLKICRLCFKAERNSEELFFEIDEVIQRKFVIITSKKLAINDNYPKKICCSCYGEFENYSLYRNGLIDKQRQLDKYANSNSSTGINEPRISPTKENSEAEAYEFNEMEYLEDQEIADESYEDSLDVGSSKMCSLCGQQYSSQLSHICRDSLGEVQTTPIISNAISIQIPERIEFLSFGGLNDGVKSESLPPPTNYTYNVNNELKSLLMQTEVGKSLLNKRSGLENSDRGKLSLIIADFFINHQRKGGSHLFREWTTMITELFPDEMGDLYFRPAITVEKQGKRFPKRATGKIPDAFYNRHSSIRRMTKNDKTPKKKF